MAGASSPSPRAIESTWQRGFTRADLVADKVTLSGVLRSASRRRVGESAAIRYTYTRGTRSGSLPFADPENKTIHSEVFTVGAREERNRARARIHFRSARRFRRREKVSALATDLIPMSERLRSITFVT